MKIQVLWVAFIIVCLASNGNTLDESNEVVPKCGGRLFAAINELEEQRRLRRQSSVRTTPKPSYCIEQTEYDTCIDGDLIEGYCECNTSTSSITVSRVMPSNESDEYYVEYCLRQFQSLSSLRYKTLTLSGFTDLALTADLLGDMMFDEVELSNSRIKQVDETFLGKSENVTKVLVIATIVSNKVPPIKSQCLDVLEMIFESTEDLKLRSSSTRHLNTVQNLTVETNSIVSVGRFAFREMTALQHLTLGKGVKLSFGSLEFGLTRDLQDITIETLEEAAPGSIGILFPGVNITVNNFYASISPAVWFNFFRSGGTLIGTGDSTILCDRCSHKWILDGFKHEGGNILCRYWYNYNSFIIFSLIESIDMGLFRCRKTI